MLFPELVDYVGSIKLTSSIKGIGVILYKGLGRTWILTSVRVTGTSVHGVVGWLYCL